MIAIVDYGVGNVRAIANIYKRVEIPVTLAQTAAQLGDATHVILPGVGAFDWAMARLRRVMSDTAVISMSRVPALTFFVWSKMSSTSIETSRTPYSISVLSMQRRPAEKPVIERNGGASGPLRALCVSCRVLFSTSSVEQPAEATAANASHKAERLKIDGVVMARRLAGLGVTGSRAGRRC
ncbi:MAG: hypothetical protein HC937_00205 [Aquincola sp.]|nr:hypothetical protein [Aquincola sp.]